MLTTEANEQAKKDREAKGEQAPTDDTTEPVSELEATEQEPEPEAEPVTV